MAAKMINIKNCTGNCNQGRFACDCNTVIEFSIKTFFERIVTFVKYYDPAMFVTYVFLTLILFKKL